MAEDVKFSFEARPADRTCQGHRQYSSKAMVAPRSPITVRDIDVIAHAPNKKRTAFVKVMADRDEPNAAIKGTRNSGNPGGQNAR